MRKFKAKLRSKPPSERGTTSWRVKTTVDEDFDLKIRFPILIANAR